MGEALPDPLHAGRVVQSLVNEAYEWSCSVRTQVHTVVGDEIRRPDLELIFRVEDDPGCEIEVWMEIKHGTAPHGRQLWSYLEAQRQHGVTNGIVLLIAPRSSYPFPREELPDAVPRLTWERLAASLPGFSPKDPVGRFLIDELQSYLKEEGLMDPDRVTPLHQVALTNYYEALLAVDAVCDAAAEELGRLWGSTQPPHEYGDGPLGPIVGEKAWGYPSHRPEEPRTALVTPWRLMWGRFIPAERFLRDGESGVPLICAGVSRTGKGSLRKLEETEHDILRKRGFRLIDSRSAKTQNEYILRLAYPDGVLAGASLSAQAHSLAEWLDDALTEIRPVLSAPSAET